MTRCTRFEDEALADWDDRRPLDEHFNTCPDCVEARAQYDAMRQGMGDLHGAPRMPEGWMDKTLDALPPDSPRRVRTSGPWQRLAAAVALVAVGLSVWLTLDRDGAPSFEQTLIRGQTLYRGEDAKVGDVLALTASGQATSIELRVYLNQSLLFSCSGRNTCERDGRDVVARVTLPSRGQYQAVVFSDLPADMAWTDILDSDVLNARERGGTALFAPRVNVR